jgi:hypothetical protein
MTIEQAIEAIRKASEDARKVGATEHQICSRERKTGRENRHGGVGRGDRAAYLCPTRAFVLR